MPLERPSPPEIPPLSFLEADPKHPLASLTVRAGLGAIGAGAATCVAALAAAPAAVLLLGAAAAMAAGLTVLYGRARAEQPLARFTWRGVVAALRGEPGS
jgi:hypothetical protein